MAIKRVVVSDVSNAELTDYVEITIERLGYSIKLGNDFYAGPHHFHVAVHELNGFFKSIEWTEMPKGSFMPFPNDKSEVVNG